MKTEKSSMPRGVSKRIMQRYADGERVLVLVGKSGKPSRVYGFDEYVRRKELTREVRPWERRKGKKAADPLGAVDGQVLTSLRREEIYE